MNNIEQAYLAEQEYIQNNLGTTTSLLDLLKPFGYNTLEEYFQDKIEYLIKNENLSIKHYSVDKVKDKMFAAITSGTPGVFAIDEDCVWAWVGSDPVDPALAQSLNVKLCNLEYRGGTIITCNKDFNVAINFPASFNATSSYFLPKLVSFLQSKGFNCYVDKNDIMLDGKKVAGSSFFANGVSGIFFISLALDDHSDLIKQLCQKEQIKVPTYLSGITKQEIEEEVNTWLHRI